MVNQVEYHVWNTREEQHKFCIENDIAFEGYGTLNQL
jgi:diketogulonate reductase-like aldo/keto reductase